MKIRAWLHMRYHGKFLLSEPEVQAAGGAVDNLVILSIKLNGCFTLHWPDIQLPSVQGGFVIELRPANSDNCVFWDRIMTLQQ